MNFLLGDAREQDLPTYVRNLHRIERDLLGVAETEIELPGGSPEPDLELPRRCHTGHRVLPGGG